MKKNVLGIILLVLVASCSSMTNVEKEVVKEKATPSTLIEEDDLQYVRSSPVLRTLRWLKENQNSDGSWSQEDGTYSHSMTGLAILCFLAHGDTPSTGVKEFRNTIKKGISWLRSEVDVTTGMLKGGHGNGAKTYENAIAFYALSEAYGMTQDPQLRVVVESMLRTVLDNRTPNGGWDYMYKKDRFSDMSLSFWFIAGLKASVAAGAFDIDKIEEMVDVFDELKTLLKVAIDDETGRGAYRVGLDMKPIPMRNPSYINGTARSLGAAEALCLQALGEGKSSDVQAAFKMIKRNFNGKGRSKGYFKWQDYDDMKTISLHQFPVLDWFFQTQVVFQNAYLQTEDAKSKKELKQHPDYKFWIRYLNDFLKNEIYNTQQVAPSRENPKKAVGWWDHPGKSIKLANMTFDDRSLARHYSTCLNCLMLEIVYRNLPTMMPLGEKIGWNESEEDDSEELLDDDDIDF